MTEEAKKALIKRENKGIPKRTKRNKNDWIGNGDNYSKGRLEKAHSCSLCPDCMTRMAEMVEKYETEAKRDGKLEAFNK